jgi:hypothetical protein
MTDPENGNPHAHGRPMTANRMPCRWCQTLTLVSTLNHYGARCFACYEAFLREPQPKVDVGDKRVDPTSWVGALQRRKDAGERLTQAQLEILRAARVVRPHGAVE